MYGKKRSCPISAHTEMYGKKKSCPISAHTEMYGKKNHGRFPHIQKCIVIIIMPDFRICRNVW